MSYLKEIKNCEVCENTNLIEVLNIGHHPLCDDLVPIDSKRKCKSYPIVILLCTNCYTAHQKYQINKKILFPSNYHYRARFTKDVLNGMKSVVNDCKKTLLNLKNKKVIDIGCNDGSLLNLFAKKGCFTFGVEPTNAVFEARESGHNVYNNYFDFKLAKKIVEEQGKFDVVVFTNVFAHIDNLKNLLDATKLILKKNGLLIIENHYLGSILNGNQFDTFYHEHPRTYSFTSFIHIAKSLNLKLTKIKFTKRYGGNIRVFLSNKKNNDKDKFQKLLNDEKDNIFILFKNMNKFIKNWKIESHIKFDKIIRDNGPVIAKAFPGRAAILIRLLGYDSDKIKAVYERPGSLKINHFVPGTRIPIKCEKDLFDKKEKYSHILNLAWHISDEIKSYMKENNFDGKVIDIID